MIKILIFSQLILLQVISHPLEGSGFVKFQSLLEVQDNIRTVEIIVEGMSCQKGCADGIDKTLRSSEGILKSKTKLETGICKVTFDNKKITAKEIIKIIESKDFKATLKS